MASSTLANVVDRFPAGTSVGAYVAPVTPGASLGPAVTTAVVAADGTLAFTCLPYVTDYVAQATVSGATRRVGFRTGRDPGAQPATITDLGTLAAKTKVIRATTGAIAGGATVEVTFTWPSAFPNANYTVAAITEEATAGTSTLRVRRIVSRTASQIVVRIENSDTLAARTGTLHAVGVLD